MTLTCPNCGKKRLDFASMTDGMAIGSTDQKYLCKDCGYLGALVLEEPGALGERMEADLKKAKKELRKSAKTDTFEFISPSSRTVLLYALLFSILFPIISMAYGFAFGLQYPYVTIGLVSTLLILAMVYVYKKK
jgi:hypothetical protein